MKKVTMMAMVLVLVGFSATAFAALTDTLTVSATVQAGTSSVAVTEASVAFGSNTPSEADHRFSAGPFTVTYFAATSPWTIRAYTDNGLGAGTAAMMGLKGADGTSYVPLKLWNENRGPLQTMADPEDPTLWSNNWSYVVEKGTQSPTDSSTWTRLAYNGAELPSAGFENYLAFDGQGVKAQAYSTVITVEMLNQ